MSSPQPEEGDILGVSPTAPPKLCPAVTFTTRVQRKKTHSWQWSYLCSPKSFLSPRRNSIEHYTSSVVTI